MVYECAKYACGTVCGYVFGCFVCVQYMCSRYTVFYACMDILWCTGLLGEGKTISTVYWESVNLRVPRVDAQQHEQQQQQQQQQQKQQEAVGNEKILDVATEKEDLPPLNPSLAYCCVLYGLPHVNYTSPQS